MAMMSELALAIRVTMLAKGEVAHRPINHRMCPRCGQRQRLASLAQNIQFHGLDLRLLRIAGVLCIERLQIGGELDRCLS
jgi:hypothetical protein